MHTIDSLTEVILYVQDMDRMLSFYTEVFGLDVAGGAAEHGFVRLDTDGCALCLHAGAEESPGRFAPKIVFGVDDLETARTHLLEHDVELGEVRSPAPGTRVCDGLDPEGNTFSIETAVTNE